MSLDLSAYKPTAGAPRAAAPIANAFTAIENHVNDLPLANVDEGGASLGDILRFNGTDWVKFTTPAVRVRHAAAQTIANSTVTYLAFDTELFDNDTMHDTATNNSRLTCKTAGKYLIGGGIVWAASPANAEFYISLNRTTTIAFSNPITGDNRTQHISTIYNLAVNDYVELVVRQFTGGNVDVSAINPSSPEFWMTLLG